MNDGIILVDKPAGITSFGVVARVRRILSQEAGKRVKIGHTGTLDPFATGLMILVIGKATKRADEFTKLDKVYEATFRLGDTSSTGDPEGEIVHDSDEVPTIQALEAVLETFTGEITQTPPIFSAIKINGVRAYKLARMNKEVEIPKRQVKIYSLELLEYEYPNAQIRVHVSSGTYIRSLVSDIGLALGTGAYTTELRRLSIKNFDVSAAKEWEGITSADIIAIH